MTLGTELIIVGGGATGLGAAYDAAQRGFKVLLVEKGDLAHGTSGRYHGLLHSGGRYAISDPGSARDCARENAILCRILPPAIEDCGGLFVATPADPPDYADRWLAACRETGVRAGELPPSEALRAEPLLNPGLARAFHIPDASCDSFDLCHLLARAARDHGAQIWLRHRLTALLVEGGQVRGARLEDLASGEVKTVWADLVLNCAGAWAGQVAALAGCEVRVTAGKGVMIAMNSRLVNRVVNRLHPPADGDILVPVGTVSILGTTDAAVPDPGRYEVESWEVELLLREGALLIPRLREFRALRAWAGVRPLFEKEEGRRKEEGADSRTITRAHSVLDHAERDGVQGLITVVGGKLTTFRLMAEQALDLACQKLKVTRPCSTAEEVIAPGRHYRLGGRLERHEAAVPPESLICECELVSREQVEAALAASGSPVLNDLRRDLRLGMGPCQGGFCIYRAAGILHQTVANSALVEYLQERWKGLRPLAWGRTLQQVELDLRIYRELLGVERLPLARQPDATAYPTERTA
ncbi:MAG: FAD-dependent oxidoreductase [Chloroflexi bacterium]|nr:FAD-dependent oxidoreductase [Chloroflexota bacterium]